MISKLRESITDKFFEGVNPDKAKELLQRDLTKGRASDRLTYLLCAVPDGTVVDVEYEDGFMWRFTKTGTNEYEDISHWNQQGSDDDFQQTEDINSIDMMNYLDPSYKYKVTVR